MYEDESDEQKRYVEIATTALVESFYRKVKEALCKNREFLEKMATALAEKDVLLARLKLADTARAVLKNGMTLIGCSAPEKM